MNVLLSDGAIDADDNFGAGSRGRIGLRCSAWRSAYTVQVGAAQIRISRSTV